MLACARQFLVDSGMARTGEKIVVTLGYPFHVSGTTNMLRLEEV